MVCNPACPFAGSDAADATSCGPNVVGYSELISMVFIVLCIGGQLKIFVCRTGARPFFMGARPGAALLASSVFWWVATLLIGGLLDRRIGLATVMAVYPTASSDTAAVVNLNVAWHKLPPALLGLSVRFCFVLFLLEDVGKMVFYWSLLAYNRQRGDVDPAAGPKSPLASLRQLPESVAGAGVVSVESTKTRARTASAPSHAKAVSVFQPKRVRHSAHHTSMRGSPHHHHALGASGRRSRNSSRGHDSMRSSGDSLAPPPMSKRAPSRLGRA